MSDVEQPPKTDSAADSAPEQSSENLESLIQSVGEVSTEEIDRVISQLEDVRAMLRREGERVTQEIKGYERLSETVMYVTKNVNDRLKPEKTGS